jgi:hypothetical protein
MSKDFKGVSQSMNASIERELTVRPEQFHSLKTGGTKHNYVTEGFLHLQGTGSVANWFRMRFMQKTL